MNIRHLLLVGLVAFGGIAFPLPGMADIYVYKDKQGVLTFTNVPSQPGYRRVIRDSNGQGPLGAMAERSYEDVIISASGRNRIDPDLIRAVIRAESNFNSDARSNKGAIGLMQLMPDTARLHNVINSFDPGENIEGGARHLNGFIT